MRRLWQGEVIFGHDGPAGRVPDPPPRRHLRRGHPARPGRLRPQHAGAWPVGPSTWSCCTRSSPTRRSSAASRPCAAAAEQAGRDPAAVRIWSCYATVGDHLARGPPAEEDGRPAGDLPPGLRRPAWSRPTTGTRRCSTAFRADDGRDVGPRGHRRQGRHRPARAHRHPAARRVARAGGHRQRRRTAPNAVLRQFDLGVDGVIMHGATPTELEPVVEAYRDDPTHRALRRVARQSGPPEGGGRPQPIRRPDAGGMRQPRSRSRSTPPPTRCGGRCIHGHDPIRPADRGSSSTATCASRSSSRATSTARASCGTCTYRVPRLLLSGGVGRSWECVVESRPPEVSRYEAVGKPLWSKASGWHRLEDLGDGPDPGPLRRDLPRLQPGPAAAARALRPPFHLQGQRPARAHGDRTGRPGPAGPAGPLSASPPEKPRRVVSICARVRFGAGWKGETAATTEPRTLTSLGGTMRFVVRVLLAVAAGGFALFLLAEGAGASSASPSTAAFGTVPINKTASQSVTITVDAGYRTEVASGSGLNAPSRSTSTPAGRGAGSPVRGRVR